MQRTKQVISSLRKSGFKLELNEKNNVMVIGNKYEIKILEQGSWCLVMSKKINDLSNPLEDVNAWTTEPNVMSILDILKRA